MDVRVAIFCAVFIYSVFGSPRKFEDSSGGSSYVLIGNSRNEVKKAVDSEDKNVRSGYSQSYPMMLHSRPSSDFYSYGGNNGFSGFLPAINPQSSLISANIHLLEPFLLVTFLLFVLSLIDKARLSSLLPRRDYLLDRSDVDRNSAHFQKLYAKRNQTDY